MRKQRDSSPRRSAKKPRKRRPKKTKSMKETLTKTRPRKNANRHEVYDTEVLRSPKVEGEPEPASEFIEVHYEEQESSFEEEKTTCLISSSTETINDHEELSISYGDLDYQEEMGLAEVSEEFKHEVPSSAHTDYTDSFDYVDCGSLQPNATSMDAIDPQIDEREEPIFVDLTADESKGTWKQSLLSRLSKIDGLKESSPDSPTDDKSCTIAIGESQIMIADSSSRPQRSSDSVSLATALKDRGPCMIPIQPNPSLPIRPAPPVPVRSSRKVRSPILKLTRTMNIDIVDIESFKSILPRSSFKLNDNISTGFKGYKQKNHLIGDVNEKNDSLVCKIPSAELSESKRRSETVKEYAKELGDAKKRKKSHEPDSSQMQEELAETILKDLSQDHRDRDDAKSTGKFQEEIELWPEKKCSTSVVSTTESNASKDRETGSKLVPPLRLKKIASAGGDRYRTSIVTIVAEKESNYRIVTGATPRPESTFVPINVIPPWTSRNYEDSACIADDRTENQSPNPGGKESVSKDGTKLRNRRNRLKVKLRDLRNKVHELTEQMADPSTNHSNSQKGPSLKQTMNCYEKQIENLSKVLGKLSATTLPPPSDIVEVDEEYDNRMKDKLFIDDYSAAKQEKDDDEDDRGMKSASLCSSPEPPKLSPRSPTDYTVDKLSEALRNSPPILPRASLIIPTNFEASEDDLETNTDEKAWRTEGKRREKLPTEVEKPMSELKHENSHVYNGTEDEVKVMTPVVITAQESQNSITTMNIPNENVNANGKDLSIDCLSKNIQCTQGLDEGFQEKKGSEDAKMKIPNVVASSNIETSKESEKVGLSNLLKISEAENVNNISVVTAVSNTIITSNVECSQAYESAMPSKNQAKNQSSTPSTNILQVPTFHCGAIVSQDNTLNSNIVDESRSTQQVSSSSGVPTPSSLECHAPPVSLAYVVPAAPVIPHQRVILLKASKGENVQADAAPKNDNIRIMNEQFPSLGSWVARMSKKQASRSKSKTQDVTNVLPISTDSRSSFTGSELQKVLTTTANSGSRTNVVNVAPQWNAERWQRQNHSQQRQPQQLIHQVAMPGTSQQPLSVAPSLRSGVCPPISVLPNSQFYPGGYSIDPYGGAPLGYHSAICHFSPYPYHTRFHAGPPLAGYHIPIQELNSQLRPLQHVDKRFAALQESMRHIPADIIKYPGSLPASGYSSQHPSGVDYDRLRVGSLSNNAASSPCLPPLLMPHNHTVAPLANPGTQGLLRPSLSGYSTSNGQCSRNRMIPDVVAAAAAAAVVAAASIGRQQAPLPAYNQGASESTASNNMSANVQPDSSQGPTVTKSAMTNDANNQEQRNVNNVAKEMRSAEFQQLQNLLMDRMPFVKTADSFLQTSSVNLDPQGSTPTTICSGYAPSHSTYSHSQSKESLGSDGRYCETPHLGKVNRSLSSINELACSNCGVIGAVFKCLGCEAAFYCDERCQTQHWSLHVQKCPKKMPKLKKVT